jgi:hypothetical protein
MSIVAQYCGQPQPHGAHEWQELHAVMGVQMPLNRQCGGFLGYPTPDVEEIKRLRQLIADLGFCPKDGESMPCFACGAGL